MNITDEKFVEVLKSLTREDFDAAKVLVDQIGSKFDNNETRNLFTEDEIKNLSELLDSYGNNYKQDFEAEATAHVKTVLEYNQQINNIRLANEQALRIAQEESVTNYKELVEKTQGIQEKCNERNKDINATITKLNSSNNSLLEQIRTYPIDPYSDSSESCEIPPMSSVYKSSVKHLNLVLEENNSMLKTLQD